MTRRPTTAQAREGGRTGRYRDRRVGSQDRSLHRLLPVRVRRLDREEPGAGRSPIVRPVRGAAGAQLHGAAPDSRSAGRGGRPQEGRRLLRRLHGRDGDRGRRPDADRAGPRHHRRDSQPRRSPGARSRTCMPSASRCSSASARRPISRMPPMRSPTSIRRGLGLPDRDYYLKTDAALGRAPREVRGADSEGARRWRASRPNRRPRTPRRCCRSRPRSPPRCSIA